MATPYSYVTVVKGRQAEYGGLLELDQETTDAVTPIIQLWPGVASGESETAQMWPDNGGDQVARDLVSQFLERVQDIWPSDRPVILDGDWLATADAFEQVLEASRGAGRLPLPVTGLGRSGDYQMVVARAIASDGQGCVLRLTREDFGEGFAGRLDSVVRQLGLTPDQIDIVLDLHEIDHRYLERDEILAANMVRALPHLPEWRNLALVGSSAPASARAFPQNDMATYPRLEWWLWQMLEKRRATLGRLPIYGDYAVIHPDRVEESDNPRALPRIPQFRITGEQECLLVRGVNLNRPETDQEHMRPLLDKVIADEHWWSGDNYSWAERWLVGVARNGASVGNAMIWKRVGLVHHWTFVIQQLASRSAL
jgi:hypothetical protein